MIPSGIRRSYETMDNASLMSEMKRYSNINSESFQYINTLLIGRLLLAVDSLLEALNEQGERPEDGEISTGEQVRKRKASKGTGPTEGDSESQG